MDLNPPSRPHPNEQSSEEVLEFIRIAAATKYECIGDLLDDVNAGDAPRRFVRSVLDRLSEKAGFPVTTFQIESVETYSGMSGKNSDDDISSLSWRDPERVGRLVGLLLPRSVRVSAYEPYFEDLKQDRLERVKYAKSEFSKVVVDVLLNLRLMVTFLQSLLCWASDILIKAAPVLRLLLIGKTPGK